MSWVTLHALALAQEAVLPEVASDIKSQLHRWGAAWEESSESESVLEQIREQMRAVNFDVASAYATWAAELPNSAGNYAVAAAVSESVALLPECLAELTTKSELQSRCPQKLYKIAIQKLFSMGDADAATQAWTRARQLYRGSTRLSAEILPDEEAAIPWPSALQTSTVSRLSSCWLSGL